jgi:hypothetical protein
VRPVTRMSSLVNSTRLPDLRTGRLKLKVLFAVAQRLLNAQSAVQARHATIPLAVALVAVQLV